MSAMDLQGLRDLLDASGPLPEAWPAQARDQALALLQTSAQARAELAATRRLHALLDAPVPEPSAALRAAVRAGIPTARSGWRESLRDGWDALGGARLALPALAAALVLGVSLGLLLDSGAPVAEDAESDLLALAGLDTDYDEY